MGILFLCLISGGILSWKRFLPRRILLLSGKAITLGVIFLLITMGIRIGIDKETFNNLGNYGLQSLLFAFITILFSLGLTKALETLLYKETNNTTTERENFNDFELEQKARESAHPYRMTMIILIAFSIGILLGLIVLPQSVQNNLEFLINLALDFTLFAVGLDLGLNRDVWKEIRKLGWFVFLAPLGVAIGSIAGGMITGKILGWGLLEGGAVGAGFGWYSLSGVLISRLHSVSLGTIAFLSNVMRELISILLVPWLARKVGPLTLVAPGGATTMDTTLPLIVSTGVPGITVVAFINGIVLSSLVPFLVPLLLGK